MKKRWLIWCLVWLFSPLGLFGEEWLIYGARARAMGGAQVAIPQGAEAAYWNPAALALQNTGDKKKTPIPLDVELGNLDLEVAITGGLLADIYELEQTIESIPGGIDGLQNRLSTFSATKEDLQVLNKIFDFIGGFNEQNDKGVYVAFNVSGLNIRLGSFALSSMVVTYGGVNPIADLTNMGLSPTGQFGRTSSDVFGYPTGDSPTTAAGQQLANELAALSANLSQAQADELVYLAEQAGIDVSDPYFQQAIKAAVIATTSGSNLLSSNNSGFWVRGLMLAEVRGSAALALIPNVLAIGGNLKILHGTTFNKLVILREVENADQAIAEVLDSIDTNKKQEVQFSMDVAVLLQLGMFRAGITARNIIPVEFDSAVGSDFRLDTQVRGGVAVVLGWITLAADVDLARNRSFSYREFESHLVSLGAEAKVIDIGVLSLALRAGIYRNLAQSKENEVYSLGFGLKVWLITIDAAFSADAKAIKSGNFLVDKKTEISDLPDRVGYAINFAFHLSF